MTNPLVPNTPYAMVLLSGGLDSVAALHWAKERYRIVGAVTFDYGQPHRNAEVTAARSTAERASVSCQLIHLGEGVRGHESLKPASVGVTRTGVSKANLPGRNLLFLAAAFGEAARTWPGQDVSIVIGCNAADAKFPDCSPVFLACAAHALEASASGVMGRVDVVAPWLADSKTNIMRWCMQPGREKALRDVVESVSCYAGTHCGSCDPCLLRAEAFGAVGIVDEKWLPHMSGGDPHRGHAR